jgi:hypothetical protein
MPEADGEGEDAEVSVCNAFGMDDSDDEAEKEYAQQQEDAKKRVIQKIMQIRQIENEEHRKEEMRKFVKEDPQAWAIIAKAAQA